MDCWDVRVQCNGGIQIVRHASQHDEFTVHMFLTNAEHKYMKRRQHYLSLAMSVDERLNAEFG